MRETKIEFFTPCQKYIMLIFLVLAKQIKERMWKKPFFAPARKSKVKNLRQRGVLIKDFLHTHTLAEDHSSEIAEDLTFFKSAAPPSPASRGGNPNRNRFALSARQSAKRELLKANFSLCRAQQFLRHPARKDAVKYYELFIWL